MVTISLSQNGYTKGAETMHYDIKILSDMAIRLGVVRNTLEKVIRLAEILKFINS